MSKQERIYALYYEDNQGKHYFYVGRTEREGDARYKEHRAAVLAENNPKFKTDVYEFIRNEVPYGVFYEEVLCVCNQDNPDDYEDFYVVQLIRAGHTLQNMKSGDARRLAATELANSTEVIRSPKDVRAYKDRIAGEKAAELRRKILSGEKAVVIGPTPEMLAERERKAAAAKKKELREKAWQEDRNKWLAEMNHLFDTGQIDALGNPIGGKK